MLNVVMLSVTNKQTMVIVAMLSVIILSVVMLIVVASELTLFFQAGSKLFLTLNDVEDSKENHSNIFTLVKNRRLK
jgi:hypothetical protein